MIIYGRDSQSNPLLTTNMSFDICERQVSNKMIRMRKFLFFNFEVDSYNIDL